MRAGKLGGNPLAYTSSAPQIERRYESGPPPKASAPPAVHEGVSTEQAEAWRSHRSTRFLIAFKGVVEAYVDGWRRLFVKLASAKYCNSCHRE